MNEHVTRFMDLFERAGIYRPIFLTAFFNEVIFRKPEHFAGVMKCAETSYDECCKPIETQLDELEEKRKELASRTLELVK